MPPKRPKRPSIAVADFKPLIKPLMAPVVVPVLERLDRHERLLNDLKAALEVQFKRTAQVQAQLDQVLASLAHLRT